MRPDDGVQCGGGSWYSFIAGVSSGIAICLVPPYLAQLAKTTPQLSQRSGLIGSMHQMGIVIGLFVAQVVAWIATGEVCLGVFTRRQVSGSRVWGLVAHVKN